MLQSGQQPSIEEWLPPTWQPEARSALFQNLLELDVDYRRSSGAVCSADHYRAHYPAYSGVIDAVLEPTPSNGALGPGSTLGPFEILREIGRGGMGVVFEARQRGLDRRVALKVLPSGGLLDDAAIQRFQNEAKAVASLHHSNIVPLFELGEADGVRYYAMQLIEGRPLDQVIRDLRDSEGSRTFDSLVGASAVRTAAEVDLAASSSRSSSRPAPRRAQAAIARIGLQVAEALVAAHRQEILHRDIKPSNLILDESGRVWVTDFGLARLAESDLTRSSDFLGTLRYMSPERFDGQGDDRVDVYALGATLYELAALRPAFPGSDQIELLDRIRKEAPPPLDGLVPDLPRDLQTIIETCLAKEPARRYRTARDLADDLQRYLESRPIRARRASMLERLVFWSRRNPAAALLLAFLLLVSVGAAIAATQFARQSEENRLQSDKNRRQSEENRRLAQSEGKLRGEAQEALADVAAARNELRENLYRANMNLAMGALETRGASSRVRALLDPWRPTEGQSDLRGFEWYLLSSLVDGCDRMKLPGQGRMFELYWTSSHRIGRAATWVSVWDAALQTMSWKQESHAEGRVAVSRDERFVAFSGEDWSVSVADVQTGEILARLPWEGERHRGLFFERGATRLRVVGDKLDSWQEVWDWRAVRRVSAQELKGDISCTDLSPDESLLAIGDWDGALRLVDAASLEELHRLDIGLTSEAVRFSPDGSHLVSLDRNGGRIRLFKTDGLGIANEWDGLFGSGRSVRFSPDGRYLIAVGTDHSAFVVDREIDGFWRLNGPETSMHDVAFAPQGHEQPTQVIGSGDESGVLALWDLAAPVPLREVNIHRSPDFVRVSPGGGEILVAAMGTGNWLFDRESGLDTGLDDIGPVPVGWSLDRRYRLELGGRGPYFFDCLDSVTDESRRLDLPPFKRAPGNHQLAIGARQLALSSDGKVWCVALDGSSPPTEISTASHSAVAMDRAESRIAWVGAHGSYRCQDLATGERFKAPRKLTGGARHMTFHPDGRSVAIIRDVPGIVVWEIGGGRQSRIFSDHSQIALETAFHPDGSRLASASEDGTVKIWDLASGQVTLSIPHGAPVERLAWTPDGMGLITATRTGWLRIYDASKAYAAERK